MALSRYKIGDLIKQRKEKYDGVENLPIRGVMREGFIPPKQLDADTSLYNVFYKGDFVFNPARMELNSIAYNSDFDKAICSSLYEIFYIVRQDLILPEYLNMFIKRQEFARKCWFLAIGSARNYFRIPDLSNLEIDLPPIEIQRKYVAIYKALKDNLKVYQSKLDDIKTVLDSSIENLKKEYPLAKIGPYLTVRDVRNRDNSIKNVKGVTVYKTFREPTSKVNKEELSNYKIVKPMDIAFVQTTHNEKVFAFALNDTNEQIVVSSVNEVFFTDTNYLLPEYLSLFFSRKEFDRYARFHSWGSARETFTMEDVKNVMIPIPNLTVQENFAKLRQSYIKRRQILDKLKEKINNICPILIRGAIREAKNGVA